MVVLERSSKAQYVFENLHVYTVCIYTLFHIVFMNPPNPKRNLDFHKLSNFHTSTAGPQGQHTFIHARIISHGPDLLDL